jgi:hypothetical protein
MSNRQFKYRKLIFSSKSLDCQPLAGKKAVKKSQKSAEMSWEDIN